MVEKEEENIEEVLIEMNIEIEEIKEKIRKLLEEKVKIEEKKVERRIGEKREVIRDVIGRGEDFKRLEERNEILNKKVGGILKKR